MMPGDEMSVPAPLQQAAITHNEMFNNYRQAGFTEYQALKLIALIVVSAGETEHKCPNCGHTYRDDEVSG